VEGVNVRNGHLDGVTELVQRTRDAIDSRRNRNRGNVQVTHGLRRNFAMTLVDLDSFIQGLVDALLLFFGQSVDVRGVNVGSRQRFNSVLRFLNVGLPAELVR